MTPENIPAEDVIHTLLIREASYNHLHVMRFVCIEKEAFDLQRNMYAFADFATAYGFDVAVLCQPDTAKDPKGMLAFSELARSAKSVKRELIVVDDNLALLRLQACRFPALYVGHGQNTGLEPILYLSPEDPFFDRGSEFWMERMAKARSFINSPKNVEIIVPSPKYL